MSVQCSLTQNLEIQNTSGGDPITSFSAFLVVGPVRQSESQMTLERCHHGLWRVRWAACRRTTTKEHWLVDASQEVWNVACCWKFVMPRRPPNPLDGTDEYRGFTSSVDYTLESENIHRGPASPLDARVKPSQLSASSMGLVWSRHSGLPADLLSTRRGDPFVTTPWGPDSLCLHRHHRC